MSFFTRRDLMLRVDEAVERLGMETVLNELCMALSTGELEECCDWIERHWYEDEE